MAARQSTSTTTPRRRPARATLPLGEIADRLRGDAKHAAATADGLRDAFAAGFVVGATVLP
jgi:hypothetical protein